jgi:hypothetical protein
MLDLRGEEWWLTVPGDYESAAVEAMRFDGSDWQRVIALTWPARRNHGKERKVLRMMISPEDALGLAEVLTHTAKWLIEAAEVLPEEPSQDS